MANLPTVSLKLLINTETKQVLFAEAGKDFVDFLFYILSLPVAKVISLVHKQGMVGSLGNLYESVENLNETYIQSNQDKNTLLKPVVSPGSCVNPLLLPIQLIKDAAAEKTFYKCCNCHKNVSQDPRATCPNCNHKMSSVVTFVSPPAEQRLPSEGGFVKGVVTYMVMDDLVVKPLSTISSITILNRFNVKEFGALQEKVVNFGMCEAVMLLKASLETKSVLTNVFLK